MAPIALVTGTSTGIGLSTAIHLAHKGFEVVATLRNPARAEALKARAAAENVRLHVRELDVQSEASVHACVDDVLKTHGRIDLLVNNAGAGFLGTLEQTSDEAVRRTMDVNFFGVWRMTQAAFPSMRARGSGRIIAVSSIGGLVGQPFNDAYCAAKFAVEGFLESLAPVARKLGIHVSLIEPGPVATEFVATVLATGNGMQSAAAAAYRPMLESYIAASKAMFSMSQTADDIAKVIVEAATATAPRLRYPTSDAMLGLIRRKYTDPTGDSVVAMTGEQFG
jgi:NAD(P)-dependent dehydrogenase (short-subunit alcohol dehydrogenase family)